MRTCLIIAATYDSFLHWCKYNGFKKLHNTYIKYEWTKKGFKILKKAIYVSRPDHIRGRDPNKTDIMKVGRFKGSPIYRTGYSHLVEDLENRIKVIWKRSYMSEIDQEFDKLLEEL